jgi:hypothetical protein
MGAIGSFINPPQIESPLLNQPDPNHLTQGVGPITELPQSRFNAQSAGAGLGPTSLSLQDFNQIIGNALAQQAGVNAGQNALVSSLQAQANGTGGPNLAQQQLQNATNQNIQSQAGAVAGLRGLNPAMAARLIANQGAAIQQGAAGQSAELRMQQQLAAQQQLGNVFAQQAAANQGQLGAGTQGLGTQNNLALQNQMEPQKLNQNTADENANLKLGAQKANLGLTDTGAKTAGGIAEGIGMIAAAAAHGAKVPGRRAYPGDDPRNDTKPYLLSPGEVVVPASIADDPEAAAAFIAAMKKHRAGRKGK